MAAWTNRSAGQSARNGTASHTITFTAASSGSLLVGVVGASALISWSAGWTEQVQPVNNCELSVATKTATAGESSFTITHNAADYGNVWAVYEYPAGSTWSAGTGTTSAGAFPNLTGLPGTAVTVFGASAFPQSAFFSAPITFAATPPWVEDVDTNLTWTGGQTDGVHLAVAYQDGVTATSAQPAGSFTDTGGAGSERVTFAVVAASGAAAASYLFRRRPGRGLILR